ncbi:MAG: NAD(+) diphosphatase [Anaerolineae bacterium]
MEKDKYLRPNFFSTHFVDRLSERRRDDEWLDAQLRAETTRFVPVWKLKNLLTNQATPKPVYLSPDEVQRILPHAESTVFLGVTHERAYFAIGLPPDGDSPPEELGELGQFRDLRWIASRLEEEDMALLAYAQAMTYWHCRHRNCGDCGSPTRSTEGGALRVCTNEGCGQQHFPRTDPAIIVLITRGGRCLLVRKSWWPEGMYSNVSGFVEPGESLEDTLVREVWEETGVRIQDMAYHSSQPWPFPSSLMLGFTARAANNTLRIDEDELEDAAWFSREEMRRRLEQGALRLPMPVSISFRLIEEWYNAGSQGELRQVIPSTPPHTRP